MVDPSLPGPDFAPRVSGEQGECDEPDVDSLLKSVIGIPWTISPALAAIQRLRTPYVAPKAA